jgi:hypothetical protein
MVTLEMITTIVRAKANDAVINRLQESINNSICQTKREEQNHICDLEKRIQTPAVETFVVEEFWQDCDRAQNYQRPRCESIENCLIELTSSYDPCLSLEAYI